MHKGEAGTINLNALLQESLNKGAQTADIRGMSFRVGDKVMHLKNNYQKEVFNGDIGMVSSIQTAQKRLTVIFEGREVEYSFDEVDELTLAYAISVHKSQRSEYPAVVIPVLFSALHHAPEKPHIHSHDTRKTAGHIHWRQKRPCQGNIHAKPLNRLSNLAARISG